MVSLAVSILDLFPQTQQHLLLQRTAGGTGTTDASGQRVFINLGNINDGNKDDFTVAATKDELYTSDGFPEKHYVYFHGELYRHYPGNPLRTPGLKTVPSSQE